MGAFSIWHLVIILLIVVALFGTAKLRNVGSDLGSALRSFRSAVREEDEKKDRDQENAAIGNTIEVNPQKEKEQEGLHHS